MGDFTGNHRLDRRTMIGITCRRFPLRNYLDPSNVLPLAAPAYVWNGSCPPYGYDAVAREKGSPKVKKALAIIREDEAALVRRIFDFSLGCGGMPLGVKAIVNAERSRCPGA
jgi:hypothetical protein